MSEKYIPEHVDPFRFAEQGLILDGVVKVVDMPRLHANVLPSSEAVVAELAFGRDKQGVAFLKGHINARLSLQCQRCMEPFICEIISDFSLGIVKTLDEANALPESYEPALATESHIALRELIEDEIILNLPIIPRHEPEACKVKLPLVNSGETQGEGKSPFQILQSLKHEHK